MDWFFLICSITGLRKVSSVNGKVNKTLVKGKKNDKKQKNGISNTLNASLDSLKVKPQILTVFVWYLEDKTLKIKFRFLVIMT